MEVAQVMRQYIYETLLHTSGAQQEVLLVNCLGELGCQVVVVVPVLAVVALDHELVHVLGCMRLLACAVAVKEVRIIEIAFILILKFFIEELACLRHAPVAAVAAEAQSRVELNYVVSIMAIDHAPNAEAVRLEILSKLSIVGEACLHLEALAVR